MMSNMLFQNTVQGYTSIINSVSNADMFPGLYGRQAPSQGGRVSFSDSDIGPGKSIEDKTGYGPTTAGKKCQVFRMTSRRKNPQPQRHPFSRDDSAHQE